MKEIPLTQGKVAIVDDDMYDFLMQWKWYYTSYGYAARYSSRLFGKRQNILMHRVVIGAPKGVDVDHINGDRLDDRRENLRLCTRSQNGQNRKINKNSTTGFKGVFWDERARRWGARIKSNQHLLYVGYFDSSEEAARAYDEKAKELFGPFARTNF